MSFTLKSEDGQCFEVERKIAEKLGTLKDTILADSAEEMGAGAGAGAAAPELKLPGVKGSILALIVEFLMHDAQEEYKMIEKPLKSTDLKEVVTQAWYLDFIQKRSDGEVFDLIRAANQYNCKEVLDLAGGKIAAELKDKEPEAIRKRFGVVNDFTPEEEAKVEEEWKWLNEA